jgi:hypothetical protein
MYLGLRTLVFLCPTFSALFLFCAPIFALELGGRKTECALALSGRVDKAIQNAALTRLNARFHDSCYLATDTMDDFFSDAATAEWKEYAKTSTFGFWIDLVPDGSEVVVRAVDLPSQLQWGQARISVISLSDKAVGTLLGDKLDRLIEEYFFIGFIENNEFFTWTKNSRLRVYAVKRTGVTRHPFLPKLIDIPSKEIPSISGVLALDEGKKKWSLTIEKEVKLSNDRIWLKSGISTE